MILSHGFELQNCNLKTQFKIHRWTLKLELSINVSNKQFSPRVLKNESFSPLSNLCFVNFFFTFFFILFFNKIEILL